MKDMPVPLCSDRGAAEMPSAFRLTLLAIGCTSPASKRRNTVLLQLTAAEQPSVGAFADLPLREVR